MPNGSRPVRTKDPVRNAVPGQEVVYGVMQALWSAAARRRFRADFDEIEAFCLFIGYPRSGHSVIGAMLNAHPHAVVSHELDVPRLILDGCPRDVLYARILARAAWFNLRGNTSNYRYQVPNRWQGRFARLRVVGDKGGGWVAQRLGKHPDLLQRVRDTVRVPLRLIHIVRNPFDNIAAISQWHRLSLDESIDFYFAHCETTARLPEYAHDGEVITVRHEEFIRSPASTLAQLCEFLGLQHDPDYLAECSSIVFERPTGSRRRVAWSPEQVGEVDRRARHYSFLHDYQFELADKPEGHDAGAPAEAPALSFGHDSAARRSQSFVDRVVAFFNPRAPANATMDSGLS